MSHLVLASESRSEFECHICTGNVSKVFTCECKVEFCVQCLVQWNKPYCLSCDARLDRYHLVAFMGFHLYEHTFNQWMTNNMAVREKRLLPLAQKYIEWLNYQKEKQKYKRYLRQIKERGFVEKPEFEIDFDSTTSTRMSTSESGSVEKYISDDYYRCSVEYCPGLVIFGVCGMCAQKYCQSCQEMLKVKSDEEGRAHIHRCDQTIIDNLRDLKENTKKCPSCYTPIIKSEGCNDMRCTNCGVRFDWVTLTIQVTNSNPYKNTDLISFGDHHISQELIDNPNPDIISVLWDRDPNYINNYISIKFNNIKIVEKHRSNLMKLRVSYLKSEITEANWIQSVVKLETAFEYKTQMIYALSTYLNSINHCRGDLGRRLSIINRINQSINHISLAYGKKPITLKTTADDSLAIIDV